MEERNMRGKRTKDLVLMMKRKAMKINGKIKVIQCVLEEI